METPKTLNSQSNLKVKNKNKNKNKKEQEESGFLVSDYTTKLQLS